MRLVVFSICMNEAPTIGAVLDSIPRSIEGITDIRTLVVSDGSSDDTAAVARAHGAEVIEGRTQRRLAFRFQQAVRQVLEMGADIAVNIDGDGQFDATEIPGLVAPIVAGEADFVAADRFTDPVTNERRRPEDMPAAKYVGNILGSRAVGALTGQRFADVTCGFRSYNRNALLSINLNSTYTYTQESFQMLAQNGMEIASVPTAVTYFPGRRSRVVTSIFGFVATSSLNIIRAYRDFAPLRFFWTLGAVPFIIGALASGFVGIRWLFTGQTSPYTTLGIIGVYFLSLGLLLAVIGLLADMQVRTARNQERIIRLLKEMSFGAERPPP